MAEQLRVTKGRIPADARFPGDKRGPKSVFADSVRRDHAQPGNHDPTLLHSHDPPWLHESLIIADRKSGGQVFGLARRVSGCPTSDWYLILLPKAGGRRRPRRPRARVSPAP